MMEQSIATRQAAVVVKHRTQRRRRRRSIFYRSISLSTIYMWRHRSDTIVSKVFHSSPARNSANNHATSLSSHGHTLVSIAILDDDQGLVDDDAAGDLRR